jgi:hypothetical protein
VRITLAVLTILLLVLSSAFGAVGDGPEKPPIPTARKSGEAPTPALDADREADALAFVRQHHPELATVLEALKPMNPVEYRKAIVDLSQVSRTLAEVKSRNPRRYDLALDAWKARSRVELLAAQLSRAPSEELRSQLRLAIEAKLDVEIRRHRFELQQAELAASKARQSLDRLEKNRESVVEARFRALQPKKAAKARKSTPAPVAPSKPVDTPNGEDPR